MTVCIVDTSVLCEILEVPQMSDERAKIARDFKAKLDANESFIVPLAAMLETGNHVAHKGDGRLRRATAARFVTFMTQALEGHGPFSLTREEWAPESMSLWLSTFPESAKRGVSVGDLSIIQVWERLRRLSRNRRVYIWSKDDDLRGYDTVE